MTVIRPEPSGGPTRATITTIAISRSGCFSRPSPPRGGSRKPSGRAGS